MRNVGTLNALALETVDNSARDWIVWDEFFSLFRHEANMCKLMWENS